MRSHRTGKILTSNFLANPKMLNLTTRFNIVVKLAHKKMSLIAQRDLMSLATICSKEYPSVPHRPPQSNTSVPLLDHTFSAPEISQFNTKNSPVQHNPLSSTSKTPQFNTKTPSVPHQKPLSSTPLTSTPKKLYISELYSDFFWCGTEGFLKWN